MKWDITIKGVDLGTLIPTEGELQPHDHPLEAWAGTVVNGLLTELLTDLHTKILHAIRAEADPDNPDRAMAGELLRNYQMELEVARQLLTKAQITRHGKDPAP